MARYTSFSEPRTWIVWVHDTEPGQERSVWGMVRLVDVVDVATQRSTRSYRATNFLGDPFGDREYKSLSAARSAAIRHLTKSLKS